MIVEWNMHLFSRDTARYPFHRDAAYLPDATSLPADPLADYLAHMDRFGITHAVVVQPEPYGDDHRLVLDSLDRGAGRLKTTIFIYPKDPAAPQIVRRLAAAEPRFVALRFHAHRGKDHYLNSFDDAPVRALWALAGDLGLVVELHIGPNYAAQAARAAAAYPTIPVLVDHLAEPKFGAPGEYADVLALGKLPNITMKMSGLNHFSAEPEPYRDTQPLLRQVAEAFGPERLAWSSGSPAIVDALLDDWSAADRARVKGLNLARLAGFRA